MRSIYHARTEFSEKSNQLGHFAKKSRSEKEDHA